MLCSMRSAGKLHRGGNHLGKRRLPKGDNAELNLKQGTGVLQVKDKSKRKALYEERGKQQFQSIEQ